MSVLPCVDAAAELREIKMAIYYINMQLFFHRINKKREKIVFVFKCNSKGTEGWVNSILQAYKKKLQMPNLKSTFIVFICLYSRK